MPSNPQQIWNILIRGLSVGGILASLALLIDDFRRMIPLLESHDIVLLVILILCVLTLLVPGQLRRWYLASLWITALLCLVGLSVFHLQRLQMFVQVEAIAKIAPAILYPHPVYGHFNSPNTKYRHVTQEFDVLYSIGEDGFRVGPVCPDNAPLIVTLGCSNTFGHGVNDSETFSYLLGKRYWTDACVRNLAADGYGPTQALILVQELLAQNKKPRLFLYFWIDDHLNRNYLSPTRNRLGYIIQKRLGWEFGGKQIGIPVLDLSGESPRLVEVLSFLEAARRAPWSVEQGNQYAIDLMAAASRQCEKAGVPLVVINMNPWHDPAVAEQLKANVKHYIAWETSEFEHYPIDGHPTAKTHARLAEFLATHPLIKDLLGKR